MECAMSHSQITESFINNPEGLFCNIVCCYFYSRLSVPSYCVAIKVKYPK